MLHGVSQTTVLSHITLNVSVIDTCLFKTVHIKHSRRECKSYVRFLFTNNLCHYYVERSLNVLLKMPTPEGP